MALLNKSYSGYTFSRESTVCLEILPLTGESELNVRDLKEYHLFCIQCTTFAQNRGGGGRRGKGGGSVH